ncbi:MAG: DUF2804 domain-containing protein [Solirubrobacteraceae bacterium]|nr:DUF2804 domain-containing protein [Solirubrobacteraceae bacterium]
MTLVRPYRGPAPTAAEPQPPGRPSGIALPPDRLPLVHAGRVRKRWRYVGVYGPELSLCVGVVRIGLARQAFWAIWDRAGGRLHERTSLVGGGVTSSPGRVRVRRGGVEIDLAFDEDPPGVDGIETVTPYGAGHAWTVKRASVPVTGRVRVDGRDVPIDGLAVIDDSGGYPPRHTTWRWSAGVGRDEAGRTVGWNLVAGIHDDADASERSAWIDGTAVHAAPVRFADDLSAVTGDDVDLRFTAEATRRRDERLLVVRSHYVQPFGTFTGTLPGGVRLAEGYGVMEHHDAHW